MQYALLIYLDGLRDKTHHADGMYDANDFDRMLAAMKIALSELAVSHVEILKVRS